MADKGIQANTFFSEQHKDKHKQGPFSHIIIAENMDSAANMGFIIRLADNIGIKRVYFISDSEPPKQSAIHKTASSAYHQVEVEFLSLAALNNKLDKDYQWIAIETSASAVSLYEIDFTSKMAFILGNERRGLSDELMENVDASTYIPMPGNTKSMNVSHALAVVLFEWYGRGG